ncbi:MAG: 5'/3'-nucleotidase SurE [Desulfurivibrionaceae bacterium]
MPRHILITNDDGIQSGFLHTLARALSAHFRISIAAPAEEQSWIGRAVSRRRPVAVNACEDLPFSCPAWTIDGTPTESLFLILNPRAIRSFALQPGGRILPDPESVTASWKFYFIRL